MHAHDQPWVTTLGNHLGAIDRLELNAHDASFRLSFTQSANVDGQYQPSLIDLYMAPQADGGPGGAPDRSWRGDIHRTVTAGASGNESDSGSRSALAHASGRGRGEGDARRAGGAAYDPSRRVARIYVFDSGDLGCQGAGGWGCVDAAQRRWFAAAAQDAALARRGAPLPAIAFFHIPHDGFLRLWNTKVCLGPKTHGVRRASADVADPR